MSVGTVPLRDETGADPLEDDSEITVVEEAPFSGSEQYAREKLRVCRMIAETPSGMTYQGIVADLEGVSPQAVGDAIAGDGDGGVLKRRYDRVRYFVTENPEFFHVEDVSGVNLVQPTFELLSLILRGMLQNPGEEGYTPGREFCEKLLRSVRPDWYTDDEGDPHCYWSWSEDEKWYLRQAFEDYLARINDYRIILEAQDPGANPSYLSLPYKTRFNDPGRVSKQQAITSKMLKKAGEWYDSAVFVTLTVWPGHYDEGGNLWECIAGDRRKGDTHDGINAHWNRFMSWIQTDSRLGYRPDYVKVLEFQENGSPHIHALLFLEDDPDEGMPWLVDKHDLDENWAKWTGGRINDVQPLAWSDDLGDEYSSDEGWVRWRSDGDHGGLINGDQEGAQTAGEYIGKYISAVYGGILETGTDENLEERDVYEDKADVWKLALYWATRRKIRTGSRDLRQAVEDDHGEDDTGDELLSIMRACEYEVVGAFQEPDIPIHIWRELVDVEQILQEPNPEDAGPRPNNHYLERQTGPPPGEIETLPDDLEGAGMLSR